MDATRFDALVRTFGTATRRGAGRLLVGGTLGGLLTLLGRGEAAAACKNVGQNCDQKKDCCSKKCKNGTCRCRKPGGGARSRSTAASPFCRSAAGPPVVPAAWSATAAAASLMPPAPRSAIAAIPCPPAMMAGAVGPWEPSVAPTRCAARSTARVARVPRERGNGRDGEGHGLRRSWAE
jgi:hypothetical protein